MSTPLEADAAAVAAAVVEVVAVEVDGAGADRRRRRRHKGSSVAAVADVAPSASAFGQRPSDDHRRRPHPIHHLHDSKFKFQLFIYTKLI